MYRIVREKEFERYVQYIVDSFTRMADFDNALDWALSRDPKGIPEVLHLPPDYYLWTTEEFYDNELPKLRILYKVEDLNNTVLLISIDTVPPSDFGILDAALGF